MVCGHLSVFLLWAPQRFRMAQITYCVWTACCALGTIRKKSHLAGDSSLFLLPMLGVRSPSMTALSWDQAVPTLSGDRFPVSGDQITLYLSVCSLVSLRGAGSVKV